MCWCRYRHENLLQLYGVVTIEDHLCLIIEYATLGSLRDRLHGGVSKKFRLKRV